KDLSLRLFARPEQALAHLLSGQIDAVVYPEPVLVAQARRADLEHRIRRLDDGLVELKRGLAVRRADAAVLETLDPVIAALQETPRYMRIYAKWYGERPGFWTVRNVLVAAGIGLAVGGMLFFVIRFILLHNLNRLLR